MLDNSKTIRGRITLGRKTVIVDVGPSFYFIGRQEYNALKERAHSNGHAGRKRVRGDFCTKWKFFPTHLIVLYYERNELIERVECQYPEGE